jgi:hypothetical protein
MAVEFQAYNHLTDREYRSRTTRAMHAKAFTGQYAQTLPDGGVLPLWLHAFGMPGRWGYPVPVWAMPAPAPEPMPRLKPVCVRCGVRPAYGLCEGCKAEWSSIQIPPQDQLGSWADCARCCRRYRPAHPAGLCYDCQHNIPIRRKVT